MNRLLVLTAYLLALVACSNEVNLDSSSTTAQGGAGGGGAEGGASGAALPPCDEPGVPPWQQTPDGWRPFACDLPQPCPTLMFKSWSYGGAMGTPTFEDPAAATCILTKLRDRELSVLSWNNDKNGIGQFKDDVAVFIVDGEHAVSNWTATNDLYVTTGTRHRQILKPPAYFDGCLQLTDPTEMYACLSDWSAGCDDKEASCPVP